MPLQNRVTPFGEIVSVPARGTLMGNRGRLHDDARRILRPWQRKAWIYCRLEFHGRHRQVMAPGQYTELFFLDEATALAAGHRPCAECQRERYREFIDAWKQGNRQPDGSAAVGAATIDALLHGERVDGRRSRSMHPARISELPSGCFFIDPDDRSAVLLVDGRCLRWSPAGYSARAPLSMDTEVDVLTPKSTVAAIRSGFVPAVAIADALR